jgi:diguanylate cyclase (GGDEF)-like protein
MSIVCKARASSGVLPRTESHTVTLDATDLDALLDLVRANCASEARRRAARLRALLGTEASRVEPHIEALLARAREVERTKRLAATDPLTRVANRRGLDEALRRELARAQRADKPLSLLLLDVDGLKAINDTLGHPAGDRALRAVARCARQTLRRGDLVARIGGDEFALLLPETDEEGARAIAQRIRSKLASAGAHGSAVRLSVGVAMARHLIEADTLLEVADGVLYQDKVARNSLRPPEVLVG